MVREKKKEKKLDVFVSLNCGWFNPIIPMAEEQEMGFLSLLPQRGGSLKM